MQMRLPMTLRVLDPLLQHILRLLRKLAVQIYRVRGYPSVHVVLSKDKLRRLLVVLLHLPPVRLALLRELFR